MTHEQLELIRNLPLFSSLPKAQVKKIVSKSYQLSVPRGQTVFFQGDRADTLPIVLSGMVKLFRLLPDGKEAIINFSTDGDVIFSGMDFSNETVHKEGVEVINDASILFINKNHLQKTMSENPEMLISYLSLLAERIQDLSTDIVLLKGYFLPQRAAFYLLELCGEASGKTDFLLPYEKTFLAARLGVSRESLSRTFNDLREAGVEVIKNRIIVRDVEELRKFAHSSPHPHQKKRRRC